MDLPRKLANVPLKSMVGSDVFRIEIVSFLYVSFRGCNTGVWLGK